jgi:peptide/nickel transport system permease protein
LSGCSKKKGIYIPNLAGPLIINGANQISTTMVSLAGLSFLGLGVKEPQAEWGSMINEACTYIQLAPWSILAPAGAMVLVVMLFSYLGDTVRDVLDRGEKYE